MKKIITYVMIFTMLITTAAVSMAVPASASVKKQSKRQVTLIRSYNKIYRKCKKNFKYDGPQLGNESRFLQRIQNLGQRTQSMYTNCFIKGCRQSRKNVLKKKSDSLDKEKRKGSSQGSGTMGWRKRTAVGT